MQDQKGVKTGVKKKMPWIFYAAALLCLLYCAGVVLTKAAGTKFFLIWLVIAAGFAAAGYGMQHHIFALLPFGVRAAALALLAAGVIFFCLVEGLVLSRFYSDAEEGLPYIVVLGAQMKENGPSVALKRRLDRAYGYLADNPDTVCIVSGGQGSNEPVSEAEGMKEYLLLRGIDAERILMEDASASTQQNLAFSKALIAEEDAKVGIVTSNFHVYRSLQLAKKQGYREPVGLSASSGLYFLPNNMLREFFGIMKDWLFGNMKLLG